MRYLTIQLMARFVLFLYIAPTMMFFVDQTFMPSIKYITAPESYIKEIKGDIIMVHLVEDALAEFNSFTPTNIVRRKGMRPITIELIEDFPENIFINRKYTTLGVAYPNYRHCRIQLAPKHLYTIKMFNDTVIHEYLHCLGYNHVDTEGDLMYKYISITEPSSIFNYADELGARWETRDKWKNLLNLNISIKQTK